MPKALRQHLFTVFKLAFAGGLIYWLVSQNLLDLSQFGALMNPQTLALCFTFGLAIILVNHMRWQILMNALGYKNPYRVTLPYTFIGLFFNYAMPGSVGGDVMKAYYISKSYPGEKLRVAFTALIDRVIGLYVMFMLACAALLIRYDLVANSPELSKLSTVVFLIFLGMNLGVLTVTNSFVRKLFRFDQLAEKVGFLGKVDNAIQAYWNQKKALLYAVLSSILSQTCAVLFFVSVAAALGETLPLTAFFFAVPLGFVLMAVPIAPAGIGVGQVAFLFLFQLVAPAVGESLQVGPVGVSALQVIHFIWSLPGAYFYLTDKTLRIQTEANG